jgi:hypothetical protein
LQPISASVARTYTYNWHTFSRSYGASLQSSLTTVHPSALGFSPIPPESVSGTNTSSPPPEAFLGSMVSPSYLASLELRPHQLSALMIPRFYPTGSAYGLEPGRPSPGWATLLRSSWLQRTRHGAGILTCLPSPTTVVLGLGFDEPWAD